MACPTHTTTTTTTNTTTTTWTELVLQLDAPPHHIHPPRRTASSCSYESLGSASSTARSAGGPHCSPGTCRRRTTGEGGGGGGGSRRGAGPRAGDGVRAAAASGHMSQIRLRLGASAGARHTQGSSAAVRRRSGTGCMHRAPRGGAAPTPPSTPAGAALTATQRPDRRLVQAVLCGAGEARACEGVTGQASLGAGRLAGGGGGGGGGSIKLHGAGRGRAEWAGKGEAGSDALYCCGLWSG